MRLPHFILSASLCLFVAITGTFAQKPEAGTAWKKTVSRVVDWRPVHTPASHHLKEMRRDSVVFEMIVKAVINEKVPAFDAADFTLTVPVNIPGIRDMLREKTDTITVIDPVDGAEITKVISLPFLYSSVHKYRIVEEWTFDPGRMKTELLVTAIAPLMEVYSSKDELIGSKPVFWLKYADIKSVISHYEQYHPDNTLAALIWQDFFSSDVKPAELK